MLRKGNDAGSRPQIHRKHDPGRGQYSIYKGIALADTKEPREVSDTKAFIRLHPILIISCHACGSSEVQLDMNHGYCFGTLGADQPSLSHDFKASFSWQRHFAHAPWWIEIASSSTWPQSGREARRHPSRPG